MSTLFRDYNVNAHSAGMGTPGVRRGPAARTIVEISDDDSSEDYVEATTHAHRRARDTRSRSRRSLSSTPSILSTVSLSDDSDLLHLPVPDHSDVENVRRAHKRAKFYHRPEAQNKDRRRKQASPAPNFSRRNGHSNFETSHVPRHSKDAAKIQNETPGTMTPGRAAGRSPRSPERCPYYYDASLSCRMYRGQGYESFPVAVGTVDGHEEKCDEWDAIAAVDARNVRFDSPQARQNTGRAENSVNDDATAQVLRNIMNVLPDIEHKFAIDKIRSVLADHHAYRDVIDPQHFAGAIIADVLESETYPREPRNASCKEEAVPSDETGVTIKWNQRLVKNSSYMKDAVVLLAGQFPRVPTHYVYRIVQAKRSLFDSYLDIQRTEADYYSLTARPYSRLRNSRLELEKKYSTRSAYEQRVEATFREMVNELQAAKQHVAREAVKKEKQKEKDDEEATNLAIYTANNNLIECQCCFEEAVPLNRAVPCQGDEMHFFCYSCVNNLAESQVGLMRHEMICMSGCGAELSTDGIGQAVPMKIFDRLALNRQQADIAAAGIDGLEQCPLCDFRAICGPIEEDRVFNCQNPDCFRATCRSCKKDAHVPKSCEEVKKDKGLSARHTIEEARTEAMVRACPRCKVKIIKELGCNKMMCTNCHGIMCYVCKADITGGKEGGYEHFNKPGSKCPIYDKTGRDLHAEEADAAEEEAVRKAKENDAELDETTLRIETGHHKKSKMTNDQRRQTYPRPDHVHPRPPDFGDLLPHLLGNVVPPLRDLFGNDVALEAQRLDREISALHHEARLAPPQTRRGQHPPGTTNGLGACDHGIDAELERDRLRLEQVEAQARARARQCLIEEQPRQQRQPIPQIQQQLGVGARRNGDLYELGRAAVADSQPGPGMDYVQQAMEQVAGMPIMAHPRPYGPATHVNLDLGDFAQGFMPIQGPYRPEARGQPRPAIQQINDFGNDWALPRGPHQPRQGSFAQPKVAVPVDGLFNAPVHQGALGTFNHRRG